MSLKQYQIVRIVTAMVLAALVSVSVIINSFVLVGATVVSGMLLMIFLKKQVREVVVDERDFKIAGKSARWTLCGFSVFALLVSLLLLIFRDQNSYFEIVGSILAYSICLLMIIYSSIFNIFEHRE